MRVATAAIMKKLDRRASEDYGIPGLVLMENAARGAVSAMFRHFPDLPAKRIGLFAGRGNNGGDALAVARYLLNRGVAGRLYLLAPKEEIRGDAAVNLEILNRMGAEIIEILNMEALDARRGEIAGNDLLVDGILGTGLYGPVKGFFHEIIEFINALGRPVVSLDIPSGLDADNGQVLGTCIQASLTVTFGLVKRGLLVYPGAKYCGKLVVVDISLPSSAIEAETIKDSLIEGVDFLPLLMPRNPDTHKGDLGHLFVLSGSPGKTGAAAMVCEAALRVGTGLITLGIPESLNPIMEVKLTEAMTEPLPETKDHTLSLTAQKRIFELCSRKSALAIGPGLSLHPETVRLIQRVVSSTDLPAIIDADGLSAVADKRDVLRKNRKGLILTPHPGEMARILGTSVPEIQQNRIAVARNFAQENGLILVLKGARSIVASAEGEIFINPTGNPGMASGGMGDVLTGMIGGFLAQGLPPLEAAKLGVYLHGLVGDFVAFQKGERGLTASDLIIQTPLVLRALGRGIDHFDGFSFPLRMELSF